MKKQRGRQKQFNEIVTQQNKNQQQQFQLENQNSFWKKCCSCFKKKKKMKFQQNKKNESNMITKIKDLKPQYRDKKTLILDLDETLVHASFNTIPNPDHILNVIVEGYPYRFYIKKRPYVEEFIEKMNKIYELIIFTASLKEYADQVINLIDQNRRIQYRLYRKECDFLNNKYVKDLYRIPRNIKDMILVDNSSHCFQLNQENGFLIKNFYDDDYDDQLKRLIPFLTYLSNVYDVRDIRKHHIKFQKQKPFKYPNMKNKKATWKPKEYIETSSSDSEESQIETSKQNKMQQPIYLESPERQDEKKGLNSNQLMPTPKSKKINLEDNQNQLLAPDIASSPKNFQSQNSIKHKQSESTKYTATSPHNQGGDFQVKIDKETYNYDNGELSSNGEEEYDSHRPTIQKIKNNDPNSSDVLQVGLNSIRDRQNSQIKNSGSLSKADNVLSSEISLPQINIMEIQSRKGQSGQSSPSDKQDNLNFQSVNSSDQDFQINFNNNNNQQLYALNSIIQEVTEQDEIDKTPSKHQMEINKNKFLNYRNILKISSDDQTGSNNTDNQQSFENNTQSNNLDSERDLNKRKKFKLDPNISNQNEPSTISSQQKIQSLSNLPFDKSGNNIDELLTIRSESCSDDEDRDLSMINQVNSQKDSNIKQIGSNKSKPSKMNTNSSNSSEGNKIGKNKNNINNKSHAIEKDPSQLSSSQKRAMFQNTHSFNTIYLDNMTKSHISQSQVINVNCSPQKNISDHTKSIILLQQQNLQHLSALMKAQESYVNNNSDIPQQINNFQAKSQQKQILQQNYVTKIQTSSNNNSHQNESNNNSNNNSQAINNNNKVISLFNQNSSIQATQGNQTHVIGQNTSDNQSYVNDLEPQKNWRDILDINSPRNSKQRELVFSKTFTDQGLSKKDVNEKSLNSDYKTMGEIKHEQKLHFNVLAQEGVEKQISLQFKQNSPQKKPPAHKKYHLDQQNTLGKKYVINDSSSNNDDDSEEINSVHHQVENEGEVGVVSDTTRRIN